MYHCNERPIFFTPSDISTSYDHQLNIQKFDRVASHLELVFNPNLILYTVPYSSMCQM